MRGTSTEQNEERVNKQILKEKESNTKKKLAFPFNLYKMFEYVFHTMERKTWKINC